MVVLTAIFIVVIILFMTVVKTATVIVAIKVILTRGSAHYYHLHCSLNDHHDKGVRKAVHMLSIMTIVIVIERGNTGILIVVIVIIMQCKKTVVMTFVKTVVLRVFLII